MSTITDQANRAALLDWQPAQIASTDSAWAFMRAAANYLSMGFHPDTRFAEYVERRDGELIHLFDAADAARLDECMARCFDALTDPYAVACELLDD
jgi:hypothetical protein